MQGRAGAATTASLQERQAIRDTRFSQIEPKGTILFPYPAHISRSPNRQRVRKGNLRFWETQAKEKAHEEFFAPFVGYGLSRRFPGPAL
jgi:hypothetical protein